MIDQRARWDTETACEWSKNRRICGFNFLPSTAVNTTELWQASTFDPATIDRELGWASEIGLNSCRVFVQYLVWQNNPDGLLDRLNRFLDIADSHNISTMFVLFDDCAFAGEEPRLGKQDDPIPGVHNSRWTPSPGHNLVVNENAWPDLEAYLRSLLSEFGTDDRVVAWDLYNEPGNGGMGDESLPLLRAAFEWAWDADPDQPLTAGVWNASDDIHRTCIELSDIISFHLYASLAETSDRVAELKAHGRPIVCTEWMARTRDSVFETHLPLFVEENVGWYFWGLVNGKTQTHQPWDSEPEATDDAVEPETWFHDIFHSDGTPYSETEIAVIETHSS